MSGGFISSLYDNTLPIQVLQNTRRDHPPGCDAVRSKLLFCRGRVLGLHRMSGKRAAIAASTGMYERRERAEGRPANPSSFGCKLQIITLA